MKKFHHLNLDKRINSTPITKLQFLIYDTIALFVYAFIILSAYVFFFRIIFYNFHNLTNLSILNMVLYLYQYLII